MNDRAFDPDRLATLATPEAHRLRADLLAVRDLGPTNDQLRALERAVGAAVVTAAAATTVMGMSGTTTSGAAASASGASAVGAAAPAVGVSSAVTVGVSAGLVVKGGAGVLAVVLALTAGRAWISAPAASGRRGTTIVARGPGVAAAASGAVARPAPVRPDPPRDEAAERSAPLATPSPAGIVTLPARALERHERREQHEQQSMAAERRLLDRAQRALEASPAAALADTEVHRRQFRDGALVEEREVIAVGALVSLGREGDARARAAAFARRYPGSAYSMRMRDLVASPTP